MITLQAKRCGWHLLGGWLILFVGAWSFGIPELLGLDQMRAWHEGRPPPAARLKTGWLYSWLRHPMYVGVLLGVLGHTAHEHWAPAAGSGP